MKLIAIILIFSFSQLAIALNCKKYLASTSGLAGCKGKNVHLTFDDGPNTTTTPKILETLKRQKVPATFFISTHQLEKGNLKKKKEILDDMSKSDYTIASHGHDHNCHDFRYDWKGNFEKGYTDEERRDQVSKSINLLNKFTDNKFQKQNLHLIRFPYGRGISPSQKEINKMINEGRYIEGNTYSEQLKYYRANSPAMSIASEYNLDHIGWNHDSEDSTSKYNKNTKDKYVTNIVNYMCTSGPNNLMSLFHDTRAINSLPSTIDQNKTVMDEIIEKAKCLGVKFQSMNQFLKNKLQAGIHTKSYESEDQIGNLISLLNNISNKPDLTCSTTEAANTQNQGRPCSSNYVGVLKHCEGVDSFCIDGQWVKSKDLYQMVCENNYSAEAAKELSSKFLSKTCKEASKRVEVESGQVACYCQESQKDNNKLMWKCFDIRSGKPKRIK